MSESLSTLLPTSLIERLLGIALEKGGDFAEVYAERSATNSVSLEENRIRTGAYAVSIGVGIRVVAGSEVGYAYSDDLEPQALEQAARVAAAIAKSGRSSGPVAVQARSLPNRYPVEPVPDDIDLRRKVELLLRGDKTAHAYDKRIAQVFGGFADNTKDIVVANSDGLLAHDRQVMCRLNFTTIATDQTESKTGSWGGGGRVGFDFFNEFSPEKVATEASRQAIAQIGALDSPSGPQTVVLAPGWGGVLLHEAVGHGLEADFIRKGTSLYAGKVGERVASELCTVIDNGELPFKRGSLNVDDEGAVAKDKVLIERGILKGYLYDKLNADLMQKDSTGSGRRQSYHFAPLPRMTNTYLAPGSHSHEEILSSVKKGLYCASLGGGSVDISNGNFVFEVREAYLIEDGKLTAPIKNATLIGIGPEVLKNVSMVGNDLELDPGIGTCGKDGQSVPVGVGQPTVRVDNLTVGGTRVG